MAMKKHWLHLLIGKLSLENGESCVSQGVNIFINPFSYLILRKRVDLFKNVANIYCDGILLVLIFRFFGLKVVRRSFDQTSLAPIVFGRILNNSNSVYLIGSHEAVIVSAKHIVASAYPGIKIVGCRNGFFRDQQEVQEFIDGLLHAAVRPDFIIVGMGTPLQEEFSVQLVRAGFKGSVYTCGGFFHQVAEKGLDYYPVFVNRLNVRWAYRIFDEPKLFKRYFLYYPIAVFFMVFDLLFWRMCASR